MARITTAAILKAIACPYLELHKGNGYWYFVYDKPATESRPMVWLDKSIPVYRLNHQSLEHWIADGRELVKTAEQGE